MTEPLEKLGSLVYGLDHPEGVAWAPDGNLYATGEAGQVYRVSLAEKTFTQIGATGGFGLGIAADAASNLYVCDMGVKAVVKVTPEGVASTYSTGATDEPFTVPNFPVFDAAGSLYVSNSGGWGAANGAIHKIARDGTAVVWSRAAAGFTNGMALSPDDRFLYVVESTPPLISRIPILADGSAGAREVVVEMPKTVPDGIAFAANGDLYISCYAPDRIYCHRAGGALEILFDDWSRMSLNAPTNIAFAGEGLTRLVVSSLGGGGLGVADLGIAGHPLHYPAL